MNVPAGDFHSESAEQRPRLILASASPRRVELLREAGYEFDIHPSNIDEESFPPALMPINLARYLAFEKAKVVAARFPDHVILAADTVVAFGDKPLGKPADVHEARRMLMLLSGTTHIVITGVCVMFRKTEYEQTRSAMSCVRMRRLTPEEIDAYVAGGQWKGKAGGYGIQDNDPFVTRTAGSHTNIVGLPMEVASEMLAGLNVHPTANQTPNPS
jgi:septum formation protein